MRKLLVAGAMLATLVAMAAILAPGALSGSGAHERHGVQLIQIASTTAQDSFIQTAPPASSLGDSYVFSEDLFRGTKPIGDSGGECLAVRIDGEAGVAKCSETFRLPEGQIVTEGLVAFGATEFTWAITGGTGAYSTAHGAVDVVETNGGVNATFSFHIIR